MVGDPRYSEGSARGRGAVRGDLRHVLVVGWDPRATKL